MATPAHSYAVESKTSQYIRSRSAEQIALERWGAREHRLAQSIVGFLNELHEGEWQWEVSDSIYGVKADSEIISGVSSNSDGTFSGAEFIGFSMEFLADLMHGVGREIRPPKAREEIPPDRSHWMDVFSTPLPLSYYLTHYLEEELMDVMMQNILLRLDEMNEKLKKLDEHTVALAILTEKVSNIEQSVDGQRENRRWIVGTILVVGSLVGWQNLVSLWKAIF